MAILWRTGLGVREDAGMRYHFIACDLVALLSLGGLQSFLTSPTQYAVVWTGQIAAAQSRKDRFFHCSVLADFLPHLH